MEDVQNKTTAEELLGEAPITKSAEPDEAPVETPVEARKRWIAANEEAQTELQKCELALAAAKKKKGEIARELQKLTDTKLPLHELNRLQREITRSESEARVATQELVRQLDAGRRPGRLTRPPLFKTEDKKEG